MKLSEKNIETFYKTLINIIEERENVKITYKIKKVNETEENEGGLNWCEIKKSS